MSDPNTGVPRFVKNVFAVVGLILLVALGGASWFRFNAGRAPDRAMAWFRERKLPVNSLELDRWFPSPPAEKNAAMVVLKAVSAVPSDRQNTEALQLVHRDHLPPRGTAWPKARVQESFAALERMEPMLAELATIDGKQESRYPLDFSRGFVMQLPHLAPIKQLASWINLRAQVSAERGDTPKSIESLEHLFRLAQSLESEPLLISQLVRIAVVEIERAAAERVINRVALNEAQLSGLSDRLRRTDTNVASRAMLGEFCLGSSAFQLSAEEIAKMGAVLFDGANPDATIPGGGSAGMLWRLYSITGLKHLDHEYFIQFHRSLQEALMLPIEERPMRLQEIDLKLQRDVRRNSQYMYLSRGVLPAVARAQDRFLQMSAGLRIQAVAVAIERYRLANGGAFPKQLEALTPKYLTEVPIDPYSQNPVRYRPQRAGYVVYSVGPDRSDDGGLERKLNANPAQTVYDITFTVERR